MPRGTQERDVVDDFGVSHKYYITPHPAEEGVDLLPIVFRFLGESGGPFVDAFLGGRSDQKGDEFDLLGVNVDGGQIGHALTNFGDELLKAGGGQFFKDLLKYAVRERVVGEDEGAGEAVEGAKLAEKVAVNFSAIYQANYGELALAAWAVIDVNFGPSWRARFDRDAIIKKIVSLFRLGG